MSHCIQYLHFSFLSFLSFRILKAFRGWQQLKQATFPMNNKFEVNTQHNNEPSNIILHYYYYWMGHLNGKEIFFFHFHLSDFIFHSIQWKEESEKEEMYTAMVLFFSTLIDCYHMTLIFPVNFSFIFFSFYLLVWFTVADVAVVVRIQLGYVQPMDWQIIVLE